MTYILITVLWLSPGYSVTVTEDLTLGQCEELKFEAKGESECIPD